jgi:multiple sugar transport system substrate-binding protein
MAPMVIKEHPHRSDPDNRDYITPFGSCPPVNSTRLVFFIVLYMILLVACNHQPTRVPTATNEILELTPTSTNTTSTIIPTAMATPQPPSSLGIKKSELTDLTIKFWYPWSGETGAAIQRSLEEFNAVNEFGITVEGTSYETIDSLYERINTTESASGLPNIAIGANYQIQSWLSDGKPVTGLNAFVNDPDWGLSAEELSDFYTIFLDQDVKEQNRFGFPAIRTAPLIFYNTSLAKELGFSDPPSSTEEFKEQACAAARAKSANDLPQDDGSGGWLINTTPDGILSWMYAFESPVVLPDGSGYTFNTPQTENAFLFLKELFDLGCAWEVLESPAEIEFANRSALFITGSLTDLSYQASEFERANNNDVWTVMGFPSPSGDAIIDVYGPSYVIFAGTPEENLAAWLVIKWLSSAEQQAQIIEARGTFPTRASTLDFLDSYARNNPQWAAAQDLLANARPEPELESWKVVRWVLGDVGTQIFRYYFTPDRLPATLELMDETAAELHDRTN